MSGRAIPLKRRAATKRGLAVVAAAACVLVLSAWANPSSSTSLRSAKAPTTIQVWLGGTLTTSTPGTTYRVWVNDVISSFQAKYPGTKVDITLLPANNDELAAKVEAAFASHPVPDLMFLYSGAYTTVYEQGLLHLNKLINSTPASTSRSRLGSSCEKLNCKVARVRSSGSRLTLKRSSSSTTRSCSPRREFGSTDHLERPALGLQGAEGEEHRSDVLW